MGVWREMFEQSAAEVPEKEELDIRYKFGRPATDADLMTLERYLQRQLPRDLRSMLAEFNGIQIKERYWGDSWRPLYLSIEGMIKEVVEYIESSANPLPTSRCVNCPQTWKL